MTEAQGAKTPGKPWHLWLIGVVGGLWNSIGAVSFMLTQLNVEAVMSQYPPQQRAYFESFPFWADGFWAVASNLGGLFLLGGMAVMGGASALGFAVFIIIVAALLAYYARAMHTKGVLS